MKKFNVVLTDRVFKRTLEVLYSGSRENCIKFINRRYETTEIDGETYYITKNRQFFIFIEKAKENE